MKTLIAVPCMEQVAAGFAHSLATLEKSGECAVSLMVGSLVYDSRNKLAQAAIGYDADRVCWFDSDMIFTPDTLKRLNETMDNYNLDIVSGLYFRRTKPYTPVLFSKYEITEDGDAEWTDCLEYPNEPFEVAGCGFGCVLMKTDVLREMALEFGTWFSPFRNSGEDLSFCLRASELGKKIFADPSIKLGHVGQIVVTEQFYSVTKGTKTDASTE